MANDTQLAWEAWQAALQSGEPVAFPGWKSVKTQPPTEEDGIILIWAENMPISVGECGDSGDYLFRECEDWGQCFEGDINWLKEHWELWMHMPEPHSKLYTTLQPVGVQDELTLPDVPPQYNQAEACAWHDGYSACHQALLSATKGRE
jgi:hypothetical protein